VLSDDQALSSKERAFLEGARRAVLATIASDGRPRLVPICFVLDPSRPVLYTPLDEKPKSVESTMRLARVRDVFADPRVSVLVDRWDEAWTNLAWLRCHGTAVVLAADARAADEREPVIESLRGKYAQYATHRLEEQPIIRIEIERATSWGALAPP
jgi:PPOX class probable F420-dependent enzyme